MTLQVSHKLYQHSQSFKTLHCSLIYFHILEFEGLNASTKTMLSASPDSVSPNKRSKVQFGTPTKRKPFTCITPIKTPTKTPTQTRSKRFTPCCENIIITSPIKTPIKTPVKSIKLSDKTPLFFSPHKSPYTPLTPTNTPGPASPASPNASRKTPTKVRHTLSFFFIF